MKSNNPGERGNASLILVIIGAGALLGVLTQTQGLVGNRLKASHVKKVSLEGQEAGLYALTVSKQLVSANASALPALGFKNPADPVTIQDISLRSLEANPNPSFVRLANDGTLQIAAPDIVKITNEQMNQIFDQKNFDSNRQTVDVSVRPLSWDPFPTGYGVKTIYFEARANLTQKDVNSVLVTRAKVPVPSPPGSCEITASVNGAALVGGASLPAGTSVSVNLACKGVVLTAALFDGGKLLATAGPVTAANNYTSDVAAVLPQTIISANGNHELQAEARLIDGTIFPVNELMFTINSGADPLICRSECQCNSWVTPYGPVCDKALNFSDPFYTLVGPLPEPLPALSGNPLKKSSEADKLTNWANKHGFRAPGIRWQGVAFPNYPNLLICSTSTTPYLLYSFDPANGCASAYVSARGVLGCLREGSRVRVSPEAQLPIENLRSGDRIWNPLTRSYQIIQEVIAGPELKPLISIELGSGRLAVTDTHPMKIQNGYVQARQLKVGDKLLWNGQWTSIRDIQASAREAGERVWNLRFEAGEDPDMYAFEAEGIIVGDLSLQRKLEREAREHTAKR